VRSGDWELLEVTGWDDNDSARNLLAWRWQHHLVVVNFSPAPAQGLVRLGETVAGEWRFADLLDGMVYHREGSQLAAFGLFVGLSAYGAHLFRVEPAY
jgi:hypothetical protein